MPLKEGKSDKTRNQNIRELIASGHKPSQAAAIAYKEQNGSKDSETSREYDINNFFEIKDNPISRVGVFPYLGSQVSPDLDPDTTYMVYRPEEELNNQETIDSFKLLPWTDDHAMLGSEDEGLTPAERKGVHGVIGENVHFDSPYLKANLKVFSQDLAKLIEEGKKELSIGYRCLYDVQSGVYDGIQYDAIQRMIRGNHLALVDQGRSGHDVAVLDHFKITLDTKGLEMPKAKDAKAKDSDDFKKEGETAKDAEPLTLESLAQRMDEIGEMVGALSSGMSRNKEMDEGNPDAFVNRENGIDESPEEAQKKEEKVGDEKEDDDDKKKDKDKKDSMDARLKSVTDELNLLRRDGTKAFLREVSQRDLLVKRLIPHIGAFDSAEMTLDDVVNYGVKTLKLKCARGEEKAMINGYLAGARVNSTPAYVHDSAAMDSNDQIDEFLRGE